MQTAQYGDNTVLDCSQHSEEDLQPTFSEEEASLPELKIYQKILFKAQNQRFLEDCTSHSGSDKL